MAGDDFTASDAVDEGSAGVESYGVGTYAQMAVIGTSLSALGYAIADAILGLGGAFMAPLRAISSGLAAFLSGTLMAPVRVVDAGAAASVRSFVSGTGALFGPFAFIVGVGVAVGGVYILYRFIQTTSISPLGWIGDRNN